MVPSVWWLMEADFVLEAGWSPLAIYPCSVTGGLQPILADIGQGRGTPCTHRSPVYHIHIYEYFRLTNQPTVHVW